MQSSRMGAPRPIRDVLDQIQHRRLGPVEVVDDEDERPLGRLSLEESPCRELRVGGRGENRL